MDERKSMIHLVTACTENYRMSANNLTASAMKHGIDKAGCYPLEELPGLFLQLIGNNVKEEQRCMFYIWKPYVIWEYMQSVPDGDIVIYADAGQTIVNSVAPLIEQMDQDILMFNNPWKHVEWCKMDVVDAVLQCAYKPKERMDFGDVKADRFCDIKDFKQVQASLIFFRVNETIRNFVKEWMLWCLMPGFCDNSPSKIENYPTFQEHRYDQAVLTCLRIKYGYKLHPFPAINNSGAPYKITDHHRKSNEQW